MQIEHVQTRARDASEQAASLRDWDQRYEQISAGRFDGEVRQLQVGPVQVFTERANQTVMQAGRVNANLVSVALVRPGDAPGWCDGHALEDECFIHYDADDQFDLLAAANAKILAISVDREAFGLLSEQVGGVNVEQLDVVPTLLKASRRACAAYSTLVEDALAFAQGREGLNGHEASRRMLALSLTDALLNCLRTAEPLAPLGLSASSRRRIVARARAYMNDRAHEVIAVPDLCQAIGTSRRALQYAFEDVMQISPVTYLRAMRLNRVRQDLRLNPEETVADVASRWGFWHPSRFASDYKALFGELPSASRTAFQRGRPQAFGEVVCGGGHAAHAQAGLRGHRFAHGDRGCDNPSHA